MARALLLIVERISRFNGPRRYGGHALSWPCVGWYASGSIVITRDAASDTLETERREKRGTQSRPKHRRGPLYSTSRRYAFHTEVRYFRHTTMMAGRWFLKSSSGTWR